jgi:hypothetical protein
MVWFAILLFVIFTIAAGIVALLKGGALDAALVDSAAGVVGAAPTSSYSFTGASTDHAIYYEIIGYVLLVRNVFVLLFIA